MFSIAQSVVQYLERASYLLVAIATSSRWISRASEDIIVYFLDFADRVFYATLKPILPRNPLSRADNYCTVGQVRVEKVFTKCILHVLYCQSIFGAHE